MPSPTDTSGMTPEQAAKIAADAIAGANLVTNAGLAAAVDLAVPPVVASTNPPMFRFESAPGLGLGGIVCRMLADRPGTLSMFGVCASALTSVGALKVSIKKNGTVVPASALDVALTPAECDLAGAGVTIAKGDKITVEVTSFSLVLGLGTIFGYIKTT